MGERGLGGSMALNLVFRGWTVRNRMFYDPVCVFVTSSPFLLKPVKVKITPNLSKLSFRNVPF